MLAARLHPGDTDVRLSDVANTQPGAGVCLVEVAACGICGSDIHVLDGTIQVPRLPLTLGHEASGIVRAIGAGVDNAAVGDRVFIDPMLVCGTCRACRQGRPHICHRREIIGIHRDGALAEFVAVPASSLVHLPPSVDLLDAAMIESASTPFHALTACAPPIAGETVAIVGVGGLGFHAVAIARLLGAAAVLAIDVRAEALERALAHGATGAFLVGEQDVAQELRRTTGGGVAVSLECVGRPETCVLAANILRAGGTCVVLGVGRAPLTGPVIEQFTSRELQIRGAFAYSRSEIARVVALIASGGLAVRSAISEIYPLANVADAIASMRNRETSPVRAVVQVAAPSTSDSQSASSG